MKNFKLIVVEESGTSYKYKIKAIDKKKAGSLAKSLINKNHKYGSNLTRLTEVK